MPELASVHTESSDGVAVVVVRGEIDMATAPMLEQAMLEMVTAGNGSVVLDLCGVSFFDSSGLHATMLARRRLGDQGRALEIVCLPERPVDRMLAIVGVGDLLSLHPDRESALAAAARRSEAASTPGSPGAPGPAPA